MQKLARLIASPDNGLIIGTRFKNQSIIRPGTVYQLESWPISGILLRPLGDSVVKETVGDSLLGACWGNDVSALIDIGGKYLFLTDDEFLEIVDMEK